MPISWNEIRSRAVSFSKQWAGESREQAEAKPFWDEFFKVYGLTRRHLASFEEPVRNLGGSYGFIDLFWKGVLLAEHKSLGKDLGKAHAQAIDYIQDLGREGRGDEVPQYVIVSDFARIALHDLEADTSVENMPKGNYLLIPEVSSQRRTYIPMGFMGPDVLCSNLVKLMPAAKLYHFGVLGSTMHMAWVRYVAGRLKSDYRYSAKLVYNNYPWPQDVTEKQRHAVEDAAQQVLDVRERYPDSSLADLYDPLSMPADLTKAHAKLDRAVDRAYRSQPFPNERNRIEFLFKSYQQLTAPLLPAKTVRKRRTSQR